MAQQPHPYLLHRRLCALWAPQPRSFHGIFPSKNKKALYQRNAIAEIASKQAVTSENASLELDSQRALQQATARPYVVLQGKVNAQQTATKARACAMCMCEQHATSNQCPAAAGRG
jgi:hypothetical protein